MKSTRKKAPVSSFLMSVRPLYNVLGATEDSVRTARLPYFGLCPSQAPFGLQAIHHMQTPGKQQMVAESQLGLTTRFNGTYIVFTGTDIPVDKAGIAYHRLWRMEMI